MSTLNSTLWARKAITRTQMPRTQNCHGVCIGFLELIHAMPLGHSCLDQSVVWLGRERHGLVLRHLNRVRLARLGRLALEVNVLALLLGSMLSSSVRLDTVDKVVTALGVTYVVNTDAHTLLNLTVAHRLVHNDTDSAGEHTVNNTRTALVVLVVHTFLLARVSHNVHNITSMVRTKETAQLNLSVLAELLGKHVPSTRPVTITVRHLDEFVLEGQSARMFASLDLRPSLL